MVSICLVLIWSLISLEHQSKLLFAGLSVVFFFLDMSPSNNQEIGNILYLPTFTYQRCPLFWGGGRKRRDQEFVTSYDRKGEEALETYRMKEKNSTWEVVRL